MSRPRCSWLTSRSRIAWVVSSHMLWFSLSAKASRMSNGSVCGGGGACSRAVEVNCSPSQGPEEQPTSCTICAGTVHTERRVVRARQGESEGASVGGRKKERKRPRAEVAVDTLRRSTLNQIPHERRHGTHIELLQSPLYAQS